MYLLVRCKLALSLFLSPNIPAGCKGSKQKVQRKARERDAGPSRSFHYSYALISKLAQHCKRRPFLPRNFSCLRYEERGVLALGTNLVISLQIASIVLSDVSRENFNSILDRLVV